jgi:serine/threonine-protein kinase RsbW
MAIETEELDVVIEIPAAPEFVSLVRLVVSSFAASQRLLSEERVDDLRLAVSEATTNAIEAYHGRPDGRVRVGWREQPDCLEVVVRDDGVGFDPDRLVRHPPVTDARRLQFERGLGIPLMRMLVDDVVFETGPGGTTVRLRLACEAIPGEPTAEYQVVRRESDAS